MLTVPISFLGKIAVFVERFHQSVLMIVLVGNLAAAVAIAVKLRPNALTLVVNVCAGAGDDGLQTVVEIIPLALLHTIEVGDIHTLTPK